MKLTFIKKNTFYWKKPKKTCWQTFKSWQLQKQLLRRFFNGYDCIVHLVPESIYKYLISRKFIHKLNPHIISMIYYLIMGELITNFSHDNLVKRIHKESYLKIELVAEETVNGISLCFSSGIEVSRSFLESKLIQHLIEIENLSNPFWKLVKHKMQKM